MKRYLCIGIISFILLLISVNLTFAFNVTPSKAEICIKKNKEYIGEFTIGNTEPNSIYMSISADKWLITEGRDATSWVTVWPKELKIPAYGSKKIKYKVKTPRNVEGEYTTSIVFRNAPTEDAGTLGIVSQLRVATYIVIKGTEIIKGEISKVEVLNTNPLKISVKVKNFGNIHIRPKGEIDIIRITETELGYKEKKDTVLYLNPIDGPIFPNGEEGEIGPRAEDIKLEPGSYKAKVIVEFTSDFILNKELNFVVTNG